MSLVPIDSFAGAEPIPPKLPQPSAILASSRAGVLTPGASVIGRGCRE